jgi:hypothetical protein
MCNNVQVSYFKSLTNLILQEEFMSKFLGFMSVDLLLVFVTSQSMLCSHTNVIQKTLLNVHEIE